MSSFSALMELLKVLNQVITWFHQFSSIVTYLSVENFHSCSLSMRAFNGHNQGAGKRPRQCCPKGPRTLESATRGPEGPESCRNTRVRGPEGPEDEQSLVTVLALASATICFSQLSQKSRFSRHNYHTLIMAKMHENFT